MHALEARALLFQRKLAEAFVDWSIPGLPELDNQLSILELGANDLRSSAKLAETPEGTNNILAMSAGVCKSLVMRDTKERVFSDNDIEAVANFGLTVLKPISDLVEKTSALTPKALEEAKKNLKPIPVSVSNTTLPTESEATPSQS